jgi:hypothetical protein
MGAFNLFEEYYSNKNARPNKLRKKGKFRMASVSFV